MSYFWFNLAAAVSRNVGAECVSHDTAALRLC